MASEKRFPSNLFSQKPISLFILIPNVKIPAYRQAGKYLMNIKVENPNIFEIWALDLI
jgi:hypothetical protein